MFALLPALKNKFGIDPNIVWNDNSGTSSRGTVAIVLSKKKLREVLATIAADPGIGPGADSAEVHERVEDLLRFILAHEFGHMRRFAIDDSIRRSGGSPPAVAAPVTECEADLWAGAAIVNIYQEAGISEKDAFRRLSRVFAAAAQMGTVIWSDDPIHPTAAARPLCVTRGVGAGMYQALLWNVRDHPNDTTRGLVESFKKKDSRIAGFETNKWDWGRREAFAIVSNDVADLPGMQGASDYEGDFRRLASLLERGPSVIRANRQPIRVSLASCAIDSTSSTKGGATIVCRYPAWQSAFVAHNWYANSVAFFRNAVTPLGWYESGADPSREVCFSNRTPTGGAAARDSANASACLTIDVVAKMVTLRANSTEHTP